MDEWNEEGNYMQSKRQLHLKTLAPFRIEYYEAA